MPTPPLEGDGTLDWARQAQVSDLLRSALAHTDRQPAAEQGTAEPIDGTRYQLTDDEGSDRWMVLSTEHGLRSVVMRG